ncbi:Pepco domain-containing protein [Mesorhizobium atlanticum]
MGNLLAQVQSALEKAQQAASSFTVEEIDLNIGINAKGGLALIGKVEAGMEAGIKVKLKRRDD